MKFSGWVPFPIIEHVRRADLSAMGEGRSESDLHLSHVLHRMRVAAGEKVGGVEGDQEGVRLQEGFLWETVLEYVAAGVPLEEAFELAFKRTMLTIRSGITTQVKVVRDGIHMTPDAFNESAGELESYKATRKSFGRAKTQGDFEQNFWPWLVQEKAYCYAVGVDTVTWIVLWQAGDYGKGVGTGPQVLQATATFTPEELVENWRVVLSHAKALRKPEVRDDLPEKTV